MNHPTDIIERIRARVANRLREIAAEYDAVIEALNAWDGIIITHHIDLLPLGLDDGETLAGLLNQIGHTVGAEHVQNQYELLLRGELYSTILLHQPLDVPSTAPAGTDARWRRGRAKGQALTLKQACDELLAIAGDLDGKSDSPKTRKKASGKKKAAKKRAPKTRPSPEEEAVKKIIAALKGKVAAQWVSPYWAEAIKLKKFTKESISMKLPNYSTKRINSITQAALKLQLIKVLEDRRTVGVLRKYGVI